MANESYVGVAVDGAGKKIRNISVDRVQSDGTVQTVQMQVVGITDPEGNLITVETERTLLRSIYREQRVQTELLMKLLVAIDASKEVDRESIEFELDDQLGDVEGDAQ